MEVEKPQNPPQALAALFPEVIDCGEGVVVQPFSLATYALLEKIGSYILEDHQPDPVEVIESLYVCTHDAADVMKDLSRNDGREAIMEKAAAWASRVPPYLLRTITAAIRTQIKRVRDVVPPPKEGELKKAATAG